MLILQVQFCLNVYLHVSARACQEIVLSDMRTNKRKIQNMDINLYISTDARMYTQMYTCIYICIQSYTYVDILYLRLCLFLCSAILSGVNAWA